MNSTIKDILNRRSVKKFNDIALERENIELIVKCGIDSPTAKNLQKRKFTIIQKDNLRILEEAIGKNLEIHNYNFYNADALVLVSVDRDIEMGEIDTATAMQNMMIASTALEIGSCWINQLRGICDDKDIRRVLDSFNIPENHVVYGMLALGNYDEYPKAKERRETFEFID